MDCLPDGSADNQATEMKEKRRAVGLIWNFAPMAVLWSLVGVPKYFHRQAEIAGELDGVRLTDPTVPRKNRAQVRLGKTS